jgi:Ca2+:H+ antiporter
LAYALLLFVPPSVALRCLARAQPSWVFLASIVGIGVLADWIRRATEQLADRAGSTIGGLLNVSFNNTAELAGRRPSAVRPGLLFRGIAG